MIAHPSRNGASADSPIGSLLGLPVLQDLLSGSGAKALLNVGQTLLGRTSTANDIFHRIERGELKLRVEPSSSFQRQLVRIEGQGRKTTRAVIFGSLLIASTIFYVNGDTAPAVVGFILSGLSYLGMMLGGE